MLRYFCNRLVRSSITILLVMTFAFIVLRLSGDPATVMLGPDAPPDALIAFREAWALDDPLYMQYFGYLGQLLSGEFGYSMRDKMPALQAVIDRIPATLQLTLPALILKLAIGVPAGIFAALHRGTVLDRLVITGAVVGFTLPSFVLGLVLVLVFSVQLGWLPSAGDASWRHAILPIATMSIGGIGILARFSRSAMSEVLNQPYVRTAVAKGLPWREVVWRHALPNAAVPIITIIGYMVGALIAGAVVVEAIFAWPGIGRLLVTAVSTRDLGVVQVMLLLIGTAMVTANLIVEMSYGLIDPRLRSKSGGH